MRAALVLFAVIFTMMGCDREAPPSLTELRVNAPVLRVAVFADGTVVADNEVVGLDTLDVLSQHVAEAHGTAWYYRELPAGQPDPASAKVIGVLLDHRVAISLSNQPDFSDIFGL